MRAGYCRLRIIHGTLKPRCNRYHQHLKLPSHSHLDSQRDIHRTPPVFRPHGSTAYVDAAYCYRRSVCRSVTIVSLANTAEPIETPCGVWTRVGPRNDVLDGAWGPDLLLDGV